MTFVRLEISEGIAHLTLSRPERLNALTQDMMDDLLLVCRRIERAEEAHVVILSGDGRAFCAGGDIDAWSDLSAQDFSRHWLRDGHQALDALARLRQPVIAVLNGHALGGGLELAACADLRIAEDHIRIGQPEPGLGVIPGWSGTQRAARRFGAQVLRRMTLFGEMFSAEEALTLGLVDHIAPRGEGHLAAEALARNLRHRGPVATEMAKMMINFAEGEERERVVDAMAGRIAASHPELKQGLDAFKERQKPDFWKR
ncbi:enoyl-CoA hydratase/isomerase family protein [Shimia sp. R11_0]|uniref:enoyl-CoA hydratase/isomerase family protein n=1 Tax=Shimia sp. R11_0 TaxID=2821096 RepID=UPI001ADBE34F|nr:enoyl-CoA hydratase/isomerase family protein [Shimia sp. R11_0]MBO9479143.1 enoyl-CoA hydratase/isomerase family protein [Shimia sp. R11_0]